MAAVPWFMTLRMCVAFPSHLGSCRNGGRRLSGGGRARIPFTAHIHIFFTGRQLLVANFVLKLSQFTMKQVRVMQHC